MKYFLTFEEGHPFAVGFSNVKQNENDVPAPEGFDPQLHEVRKKSNGKLELVEGHEERRKYDDKLIAEDIKKSEKAKAERAKKAA